MPQPRKHECITIDGEKGVVRNRNGWASLRFGDEDIATGLRFCEKNRKALTAMLRAHQKTRKLTAVAKLLGVDVTRLAHGSASNVVAPDESRPITLHQAIEEYKSAKYAHVSPSVRGHHNRSFNYYVTKDVAWDSGSKGQRSAAGDAIGAMLKEQNNSPTLDATTKHQYFYYIRQFFDFVVASKWLDTNPMSTITRPRRKRGSPRGRWLPEELTAILKELRSGAPSPVFAHATAMLAKVGMRDGEALKLTRAHARTDYLPACSKTQSGQKPKVREVPVKLLPGLRKVLNDLLAMPSGRGDALLPWSTLDVWCKEFNKAVDRAGIERNGRTLNCLRKTAIWWMEHDLGWDRQHICDVVGHTEEVDDEYYREAPTGKDVETRIRRKKKLRAVASSGTPSGPASKRANATARSPRSAASPIRASRSR